MAGIIGGDGTDSAGAYAGVAPGTSLLSLKVLDGSGRGTISTAIQAIDYAIANRTKHNIRVINLSVGAAATESFFTDPFTLAAWRAVQAGITVVAAAGNLGRDAGGNTQYGGVTAPGNAPWVLTVGASNHMGDRHSRRRRGGRVQLARTHGSRPAVEAGPRRSRHADRLARGRGQHTGPRAPARPGARHFRGARDALSHAHRHQHGSARGQPAPSR